jgi:hypothetical protein
LRFTDLWYQKVVSIARDMTGFADDNCPGGESLYEGLTPGAKLLHARGVKLSVSPFGKAAAIADKSAGADSWREKTLAVGCVSMLVADRRLVFNYVRISVLLGE